MAFVAAIPLIMQAGQICAYGILPMFAVGKMICDTVADLRGKNSANKNSTNNDDQKVVLTNTMVIDGRLAPESFKLVCLFLNTRRFSFKSHSQIIEFGSDKLIIPAEGTGCWHQTWRGKIYIAVKGLSVILGTNEDDLLVLSKRVVSHQYHVKGENKDRRAWFDVAVFPEKHDEFLKALKFPTMNLEEYGYVVDSGWGVKSDE